MKIHFGHKIAIVYLAFMLFMLGLLYMSLQMDHELVTDQYYEKELAFQGRKDAWTNLQDAPFSVHISKEQGAFAIRFTHLPEGAQPTGEVSLYKPDNAGLDEQHPLVLDHGTMTIVPRGAQGRYKVSVRFELDGRDYYTEQDLLL
jgi:hypothetical protein